MKNLLAFVAFVLLAGTANAQSTTYRRFKVDLTTGYSRPSTPGLKGGFNLSIEPKFNVTDQIAIGVKIEGAVLASVRDNTLDEGRIAAMRASLLTGEYYFGQGIARPYIGAGLGLYKATVFETDGWSTIGSSDNRFGFAPRAGLQLGHFRMGVEYNLVNESNYLSFKLGTTFGGGRKK